MARGETNIEIRLLSEQRQFREAVALQKAIWGFEEIELLPVRLFVVAAKVGGHVAGAYDDGRMIGFCLAIPGLKPGGQGHLANYGYLHSHMLGVLPAYRDMGIGRRLKLRQREDAMARGIELIEWTFDPLEIKNAYFNVERLGAVVRRYVRNQYGTTTSHLHGGLPTDRCIAEWWLNSARAIGKIDGGRFENPAIAEHIEVPAKIADMRRDNPERARALQAAMANRFDAAFGRGFAVVGIERAPECGAYLLADLPAVALQ